MNYHSNISDMDISGDGPGSKFRHTFSAASPNSENGSHPFGVK